MSIEKQINTLKKVNEVHRIVHRNNLFTRSAREYFTEPNRDFALVCQYAGFDHEYIRMKAKHFFKERKENEKNMYRM